MISTLPPPMSMHSAGAGSSTTLARTAAKISRASSRPLITSTSTPVSASMRSTSSLPFAAVRIALVALAITSLRAERVGELAEAAHARDRAVGRRGRDAAVAGDVVAEAQHLLLAGDRASKVPSGCTSATSRWKEFDPRSSAAMRMRTSSVLPATRADTGVRSR